jgi:hypothetical protein
MTSDACRYYDCKVRKTGIRDHDSLDEDCAVGLQELCVVGAVLILRTIFSSYRRVNNLPGPNDRHIAGLSLSIARFGSAVAR